MGSCAVPASLSDMRKPVTYENAGVSIRAADKLVEHLKKRNAAIGGFSGLYPLPVRGMKRPQLVASTDGVGTKLLVAKASGQFSTIGIDLVAMVVNDLVVCGAKPLFFLDYYATGKLELPHAKAVLDGIFAGCAEAGMTLLGGETAELPGLYQEGDFDLAGFGVGVVDGASVIDGRSIRKGHLVFGVESTGLHSNGYSLARRVLLENCGMPLRTRVKELGTTLGQALLQPTRIYAPFVARMQRLKTDIRGMAHITGGGLPGNLNRVLPPKLDALLYKNRWDTPPLFKLIQRLGPVDYPEMLSTFNVGIGYTVVAPVSEQARIARAAVATGDRVHVIGEIVPGSGKVRVEVE